MTRYIDESKIKFTGDTFTDENKDVYIKLSDVRQAIAQAPTADVVEVVRCKDCKYFKQHKCIKTNGMVSLNADNFCSCGESR